MDQDDDFAHWKSISKPMPEQHTTIQLNYKFTEEDMTAIKNGLTPQEMEDKWFVYYEQEQHKLYMHRSWTGFCVYIVTFEESGDGSGTAVSMVVNRDSSQYTNGDDELDKTQVGTLIGVLLLSKFGFKPGVGPV